MCALLMRRGYSNLIKKIRGMSDATTPLFPVAGKEAPPPIQRPV